MTKKEELQRWKNRLSWCRQYYEPLHKKWTKAVKLYETLERENQNNDDFKLATLYASLSSIMPLLFADMPKIKATPVSHDGGDFAFIVEDIVEQLAEEIQLFEELQLAVMFARICGVGYVKLGVSLPENKPIEYPETLVEEPDTERDMEQAWIDFVRPDKLFLDPEASKLESCRYIMHEIDMTKDEFIANFGRAALNHIDAMFVKTAFDGEEASKAFTDFPDDSTFGDFDRYTVYEIFCKEKGMYYVLSEGSDEFLRYAPWPHEMKSYPFESLVLNRSMLHMFGICDTLFVEQALIKIDELFNKEEDMAARSRPKHLFAIGALTDDQLNAVEDPDMDWVEINDINMIRTIEGPTVPPDTFNVKEDLKRVVDETLHISSQRRQVPNAGKKTATEIQEIASSGDAQLAAQVKSIERFIARIIRKLMALVKQYYTQERISHISQEVAGRQFIPWKGNELGEWEFTVKAGSAAYTDDALQSKQIMQTLSVLEKYQGLLTSPAIIVSLLEKQLKILGVEPALVEESFQQPQQPAMPQQPPEPQPALRQEQIAPSLGAFSESEQLPV